MEFAVVGMEHICVAIDMYYQTVDHDDAETLCPVICIHWYLVYVVVVGQKY